MSLFFTFFLCFLRLEELIDVVFPSLSLPSYCSVCSASNADAWIPCCCFLSILSLGVKWPSPFHLFMLSQSSKACWLPSSFLRPVSCFFSCIRSNLFLQFLPCQCLRRCLPMMETSLSWLQSVFELSPSSVSPSEFLTANFFFFGFFIVCWLLIASCLFSSLFFLTFCLVFLFCRYNEAKHLALCRSDHFFVFIREGPRSRGICQCGS